MFQGWRRSLAMTLGESDSLLVHHVLSFYRDMKQKQQETIWMVEYFCPDNFNGWSSTDHPKENDLDGKDPIEAFFDFTSRGIKPEKCTDWVRYNKLVVGLQWMTTHEKMYREGFIDKSFSIMDFNGKPPYFKKWINRIWNNVICSK